MPRLNNFSQITSAWKCTTCSQAVFDCHSHGVIAWIRTNRAAALLALYMLIYLIIGVSAFVHLEGVSQQSWTFTESLYYNVITVTTVGFGDFHVTYTGSRVFAIFHSSLGFVLFAMFVGIRARKTAEEHVVLERLLHVEHVLQHKFTDQSARFTFWKEAAFKCLGYWCMLGIGALYFSQASGFRFNEALYISLGIGTTCGYGDSKLVPSLTSSGQHSVSGMWFSIFYAAAFFVFTTNMLAWVTANSSTTHADVEMSMAGKLSEKLLATIDINKDNHVDRFEWLQAVLLANDICDKVLLDKINQRFDELDTDGSGSLTTNDLHDIIDSQYKEERESSSRQDSFKKPEQVQPLQIVRCNTQEE
eukprot:gene9297-1565_t